ncbi:MAG: site-specific DNA-methyltransferase, partial [Ignavibacteriaceae bacterium]|nr:site-specific DNA-methyltransferase [Ignavibacteriaceae bacterium]
MLKKKPAGLNRSLRLTEAELIKYSSQLINLTEPQKLKSVTNKIINQDILSAVKYLPENFVDLLFIDPPYNITKKFNRVVFREMNNDEYEVWLDSWLSKLIVLLKENSSIYICGDWKSSSAIFRVGSKY